MITVASQPSPAAWIAGIATQVSVHRPAAINCLRPVAFSMSTTSLSSHVLMKVRSIASWPGITSVIWGMILPPRSLITPVRMGGDVEDRCSLDQDRGIADDHLRVMTVEIAGLVWLVIDQDQH